VVLWRGEADVRCTSTDGEATEDHGLMPEDGHASYLISTEGAIAFKELSFSESNLLFSCFILMNCRLDIYQIVQVLDLLGQF
jgi:hypothetical protein